MKFKSTLTCVSLLVAMSLGTFAHAQTTTTTSGTVAAAAAGADRMADMTDMTDGEVRKIDKENKKITLKHGEIRNLQMPGMTMVFQVKDSATLDNVKQGDKVRFKADKVNGAMVVTEMHPAK